MRVADLRSEVGLPVTSGPGALQSPLPAHVLRKHHRLLLSPAPPARNTGPLRPSPLSLKALRPAFANGNHYNHAPSPRAGRGAVAVPNANTASPRQRRPMKMRLPALPALDSSSAAAAVENHSTLEEQFKIERKLEAAIYGCVLKAHRRSDGKAVAIKVLSKEHIRRRTSMKDMPVFENAEVELSVLQKSAECPHPNVLRSLAAEAGGSRDLVLHDAKHIYCITPFCDNGELFDAVRSAGGLPAAQATRLFAQIARGVHHLHTRLGYVHNDISPENILLRSMRRVGGGGDADPAGTCTEVIPVLTDFGLAAEIGRPAPRVPGKVSYQAPEVLYGGGGAARPAAASSDVFSLGVLFFVMLTGVLPYDRPQTSDPKFAALQEGAGVFGAAAAEWDVAGCTALVAEHPRLLRLICAMTRADADARPTLDAVMSALESGERPLDAAATGRLEVLPATVGATTAASATNTPKTAEAVSEAVPGTAAPPTLGAVLADQPLRGRLRRKQRRSTGQRLALQQSVAAAGLMSVDDSVLPSSLSSSAHSSNGGCGGVNDDDDTGGGVTSDEEGGCSLSLPVPAPAAGFAEWRHRPVDTGHPLARQHQQHRRCSTFLASPSPTLGVNSPSGVADIAFMSLGGAVTATPAFAGFAAAAHEVTARALLSSSCSRSSSGSNNKKQHASEQRQHNRRRRRQHNRPQQTPSLAATMSPTTSSSPPSLRKRRATKASPTAAAPPSTPGLLQHVLQRGIQLEKFRASED